MGNVATVSIALATNIRPWSLFVDDMFGVPANRNLPAQCEFVEVGHPIRVARPSLRLPGGGAVETRGRQIMLIGESRPSVHNPLHCACFPVRLTTISSHASLLFSIAQETC